MLIEIDREPLWKIWFLFFVYTVAVSLTIQLLLLPYIFPHLHLGDGISIAAPDSYSYHRSAVLLSQEIDFSGWSALNLNSKKEIFILLPATLYAISTPMPYVLIPVNSALHATSTLILLLIIQTFAKKKAKSLICVIPFLIYPSAASWYAQILKDNFSITGSLLILCSLIYLSRRVTDAYFIKSYIFSVLLLISGITFLWFVRGYMLQLERMMIVVPVIILLILLVTGSKKNSLPQMIIILRLIFIIFIPLYLFPAVDNSLHYIFFTKKLFLSPVSSKNLNITKKNETQSITIPDNIKEFEKNNVTVKKDKKTLSDVASTMKNKLIKNDTGPDNANISEHIDHTYNKEATEMFNNKLYKKNFFSSLNEIVYLADTFIKERYLYAEESIKTLFSGLIFRLIDIREGFRHTVGRSSIERDVQLTTVSQFLANLPRGAQIGFFYPTPQFWFEKKEEKSLSLYARYISCLEMPGIYLSLFFLPLALWKWRKSTELWILMIFSVPPIVVYGSVILNIGTLHRMRYGFLMTIVAVGIAGLFIFLEILTRRSCHQKSFKPQSAQRL